MIEHSLYRYYLKVFTLSAPCILLLVVCFNFIIDPYAVNNAIKIDGININKPEIASHLRMSKAYQVLHQKPLAIILGTSRAEFGLDPDHPGWSFQPTYNLNLSSGNIYEMLRYFQHANQINPLKQVVLALDFFQFNINGKNSPDFDENRLAVDLYGQQKNQGVILKDMLATLISLDALKSSIDTLSSQYQKPLYLPNGLLDPETTTRGKLLHIIGARQVFINSERRYFTKTYHNYTLSSPSQNASSFDHYRRLLTIAYEKNIDFRLLIGPSHARQFETIAAKGLWLTFEAWKRQLVEINEEQAEKAHSKPFHIWDFSGYNAYTTEEVPPLGDITQQMQWYWESSHYKKELGDLALDQIFNQNVPGRSIANDFGIQLSSDNINQHINSIRQARKRWRQSHPEDVAEIEALSLQYHK